MNCATSNRARTWDQQRRGWRLGFVGILLSSACLVRADGLRDMVIFADEPADNWAIKAVNEIKIEARATEEVFEGTAALALEADAFTVAYQPDEPVNPAGFRALHFAFHPGNATAGSRGAFNIIMNSGIEYLGAEEAETALLSVIRLLGGGLEEGIGIDMERKAWQVVEIPLTAFTIDDASHDQISPPLIEEFRFVGSLKGTFYLDDLRLVSLDTPLPDTDYTIFADGTGTDWEKGPQSNLEIDPAASTQAYEGEAALEIRAEVGFAIDRVLSTAVNPIGYRALRFAFHPGDLKKGFRPAFNVVLNPATLKAIPHIGRPVREPVTVKLLGGEQGDWVDLDLKEWQVIEIPLEEFPVTIPISEIRLLGNLSGTFYLDDVRLVAARPGAGSATAVLEEHTASVPHSFALSQNFPNPFNSSTVIRFALPADGEVELAIYNTMGQRMATLASGKREAGMYAVHWDGRDERGQELASGMYLYRLTAGSRVENKKLLLLK